ncbi:hypothetical protein [Saccharopolyspora rosea]|uniref:Uncharacterized protein n=1 Tax=Saccharopolyspora rosea TaxID=524884 RepID=A0ABW3FWH9_9PSEU|nr:hypothetical protein [Saccharopolyspora rosea]
MTDEEQRHAPAGGVCAHVGIGADDAAARHARTRLANVLAVYRRALLDDAPGGAPAPLPSPAGAVRP